MEKVRYMISDAANIVNVESHVLRYWEDELDLNIPRNEMGHRYYTKENIQEFQRIKELKEQGYQLKAIRMIVHNGSLDPKTAAAVAGMDQEAPPNLHQIKSTDAGSAAAGGSGKERTQFQNKDIYLVQGLTDLPVESGQASQIPEIHQGILNNTDKMAQFTDLMTQIVGKAIAANNGDLSKNISDDVGEQVLKEMNYLMREREEAEEERFRKLDDAIRGNLKKKDSGKKIFKKKKPSQ